MRARSSTVAAMSSVPPSTSVVRAGRAPGSAQMNGTCVIAFVMRRPLQQQPVVAEKIAVVGGEDHDRVVGEAARRQLREHAADGVVDHRDHAAAQRHRLARLALVDGERRLLGGVGLAALALRQRPGDRPRQRPVAVVEARRQRHVLAAGTWTSSGRAA